MPFSIESARKIFPETAPDEAVPATIARFNQLSAEDQLALIWFAYKEMGKAITIAAPGAANMAFAELTLQKIYQMNSTEQTQVMCDLVNRVDTEISRTYGSWSPNIKLGFWYQLGVWMDQGFVAPIPDNYQLSANASSVLQAIRQLQKGQQITVLRNTVVNMGVDSANLGNTKRVTEPVEAPKEKSQREPVNIEGISNPTILSYMIHLNANDFDALIELFEEDGGLQPPFRKPLVGKDQIYQFFFEECKNLKLLPERGVSEPADDGYTQIKVTGKVQSPWFGAEIGMNVAWRFLLNDKNKIFFVAIDLLASPKELMKFAK